MSNRLTHDNVEHNPSASYLFIEDGGGFVGKRLSLVIIGEDVDSEKIKAIRHRTEMNLPMSDDECKYLVHFHIEGVRRCAATNDEAGMLHRSKNYETPHS